MSLAILLPFVIGVAAGLMFFALVWLSYIVWSYAQGRQPRSLRELLLGAPQGNPLYVPTPDESTDAWTAPKAEHNTRRHELEATISLEDRVALARFVVTMCGYGPYGASATRLDQLYTARMNYLKSRVSGVLRQLTGLPCPAELPNEDAQRVFEELAHNESFLNLCKKCATLLDELFNERYLPLAEASHQEPDVIPLGILPSREALKLLIG